jgi:branched-chain amino acid transport system ATP-binding protein
MLRLEGMSCGYGPMVAVHELSLHVPEGAIFALLGANGAGKSSTIMSIAGHVAVTGGAITFAGEDITSLAPQHRVGRGIAIVPEGRRLFSDLSVEENLTVGGYSRPKAAEASNRDRVYELFPRLAERRRQTSGSLSGGEQQMLAIGRALMAEPTLLMIDEMSLGLMPKAVDLCFQVIERLRTDGITVLLVEQSTVRALAVADWVCVLESGRGVFQGTGAEARDDPALFDTYLGLADSVE